jgi:V-type H+-transporting ATPase subunit C
MLPKCLAVILSLRLSSSFLIYELVGYFFFVSVSGFLSFSLANGLLYILGTLDDLMTLSDELQKSNIYADGVTKKMYKQLFDLLDDSAEDISVNNVPLTTFIKNFSWNEARYPVKLPLKELALKMKGDMGRIEEDLKNRGAEYSALRQQVNQASKKKGGNLTMRALDDLITPEDVMETESITTLFVVVAKYQYSEWLKSYEKLTEWVVPRSSVKLTEDQEYGLFTVCLFRKDADEFKLKARERRFNIRDHNVTSHDSAELSAEQKEQLERDLANMGISFLKWSRTNFSEAFTIWMHLKAVSTFCESILRYGVPRNFHAMVLEPNAKREKNLRVSLNKIYADASSSAFQLKGDETGDVYPYVYLQINMTF